VRRTLKTETEADVEENEAKPHSRKLASWPTLETAISRIRDKCWPLRSEEFLLRPF